VDSKNISKKLAGDLPWESDPQFFPLVGMDPIRFGQNEATPSQGILQAPAD
jgi:hypothetical protein